MHFLCSDGGCTVGRGSDTWVVPMIVAIYDGNVMKAIMMVIYGDCNGGG